MKQYFTELEAAEAAGVSLVTIKEFVTLGVLKLNPANSLFSQDYFTYSDLIGTFHNLKDLGVTVEIPIPAAAAAKAEEIVQETLAEEIEVRSAPTETIAQPLDHDHGNTFIEHRSFELLDLNKSLKDQIEILKQERDWLRKRVETMEIRAERDQLLLMSETKNVQRLLPLHTNESRRGFWSWLTSRA